jgi:hypothetical protein
MSGNLLLGLTRDGGKGFEVIETERSPLAPRSGLILELAGEGRGEERTMLAAMQRERPAPACRRGISGGSDSLTGASGAPRRC